MSSSIDLYKHAQSDRFIRFSQCIMMYRISHVFHNICPWHIDFKGTVKETPHKTPRPSPWAARHLSQLIQRLVVVDRDLGGWGPVLNVRDGDEDGCIMMSRKWMICISYIYIYNHVYNIVIIILWNATSWGWTSFTGKWGFTRHTWYQATFNVIEGRWASNIGDARVQCSVQLHLWIALESPWGVQQMARLER